MEKREHGAGISRVAAGPQDNRIFAAALALVCIAATTRPATPPADTDLDDILRHATTAPATQPAGPASQPASPFPAAKDLSRIGTITLSDGLWLRGPISHTADKPFRIWAEKDSQYHDIPFTLIRKLEAEVLWERQQPEWHFKESGSDIKEYSGKSYPARETSYTLTLVSGEKITGSLVEPLYLQVADGQKLFALHKRDKGEVGQRLDQLVYVRSVDFE